MFSVPRLIFAASVPAGASDQRALHFSGRSGRFIPSKAAVISLIIEEAWFLDAAKTVILSAYASNVILSRGCDGSISAPILYFPLDY
jgi:hypothetical protein